MEGNGDPYIAIDMDYGNIIISNSTSLKILSFTSSTIGIVFSTIALVLLITTAILFPEWRRIFKNQVLIQFMIARFLFILARYIYDVTKVFEIYAIPSFVEDLDLFVLFYTEMALMAWMLIFTKQMYNNLVKLFPCERPQLWKISLAAWFIPFITASVFFILLVLRNNQLLLFLIYLSTMKWPVLITVAVLLIVTLKSIVNVNKGRTELNSRIIIAMVFLIFIFCIQQIAIDIYKLVTMIIFHKQEEISRIMHSVLVVFNIASIYHCAFSILFWLFGNARTRKLWRFEDRKGVAHSSLHMKTSV